MFIMDQLWIHFFKIQTINIKQNCKTMSRWGWVSTRHLYVYTWRCSWKREFKRQIFRSKTFHHNLCHHLCRISTLSPPFLVVNFFGVRQSIPTIFTGIPVMYPSAFLNTHNRRLSKEYIFPFLWQTLILGIWFLTNGCFLHALRVE